MQIVPIYVQKRWQCPNIQNRHWPPNADAASAWHFQLPGEKRVKNDQVHIDFRWFAAYMCKHMESTDVYGVSWFNPWSFAVFAGFQDHVNIVGTQTKKQSSR